MYVSMHVCMCVCAYAYIYIHVYTYIHTLAYLYTKVCMCMCVYIYYIHRRPYAIHHIQLPVTLCVGAYSKTTHAEPAVEGRLIQHGYGNI